MLQRLTQRRLIPRRLIPVKKEEKNRNKQQHQKTTYNETLKKEEKHTQQSPKQPQRTQKKNNQIPVLKILGLRPVAYLRHVGNLQLHHSPLSDVLDLPLDAVVVNFVRT